MRKFESMISIIKSWTAFFYRLKHAESKPQAVTKKLNDSFEITWIIIYILKK